MNDRRLPGRCPPPCQVFPDKSWNNPAYFVNINGGNHGGHWELTGTDSLAHLGQKT